MNWEGVLKEPPMPNISPKRIFGDDNPYTMNDGMHDARADLKAEVALMKSYVEKLEAAMSETTLMGLTNDRMNSISDALSEANGRIKMAFKPASVGAAGEA